MIPKKPAPDLIGAGTGFRNRPRANTWMSDESNSAKLDRILAVLSRHGERCSGLRIVGSKIDTLIDDGRTQHGWQAGRAGSIGKQQAPIANAYDVPERRPSDQRVNVIKTRPPFFKYDLEQLAGPPAIGVIWLGAGNLP